MKHSTIPYLTLDALFEGGRMFVGATSAAYLISRGITLGEIALLKSLQAGVMIFAEVPTGLVSDIYGSKKSLILSLLCAVAGFALYFSSNSFLIFLLAEVLVALSLCFWSGAYESFVIESAELESQPGRMDQFFHSNQALNSAAVLVFGFLGGWIGQSGLGLPYLGAALVLLFTLACLLPLRSPVVKHEIRGIKSGYLKMGESARLAFSAGLFSKNLAPFFWVNIAIQFSIQPLIQFWQPLFLELSGSTNSQLLGTIFALYCGTNLIFGTVAARFSKLAFFQSSKLTTLLLAIFGGCYALVGLIPSLPLAIVLFCLAQGCLAVARTSISVRLNKSLGGLPRASILGSLSLVSRIGMVAALGTISFSNQILPGLTQQNLYTFFGTLTLVVTFVVTLRSIFISFRTSKKELL